MTRRQEQWLVAAKKALADSKSISIENENCLDELTRVSMEVMNLLQCANRHLLSPDDSLIYVGVRMLLLDTYLQLKRNERLVELRNIPSIMDDMVHSNRLSLRET